MIVWKITEYGDVHCSIGSWKACPDRGSSVKLDARSDLWARSGGGYVPIGQRVTTAPSVTYLGNGVACEKSTTFLPALQGIAAV